MGILSAVRYDNFILNSELVLLNIALSSRCSNSSWVTCAPITDGWSYRHWLRCSPQWRNWRHQRPEKTQYPHIHPEYQTWKQPMPVCCTLLLSLRLDAMHTRPLLLIVLKDTNQFDLGQNLTSPFHGNPGLGNFCCITICNLIHARPVSTLKRYMYPKGQVKCKYIKLPIQRLYQLKRTDNGLFEC